ncbi:MAG: hypothetical protein ABEH35_06320 [Haloarculaceae archaeon]
MEPEEPDFDGIGGGAGFESRDQSLDTKFTLPSEEFVPELCLKCGMEYDSTEVVDAPGEGLFRHFYHGEGPTGDWCRVPIEDDQ